MPLTRQSSAQSEPVKPLRHSQSVRHFPMSARNRWKGCTVNSYSRQTLRRGAHRTANGPYGAPRGNAIMAAKRTSGPSAERIMRERMACETCTDCGKPAITSRTLDSGAIYRRCRECALTHSDRLPSFVESGKRTVAGWSY